jgi:REP element-mobilizing transposase RayT
LPATESIAELLRVVKANSSRWVHEGFPAYERFGWQAGYAAFTVSSSRVDGVRTYIAAQQEHHRRVSFEEEFLAFLQKHGVTYDPRDLWG